MKGTLLYIELDREILILSVCDKRLKLEFQEGAFGASQYLVYSSFISAYCQAFSNRF